jgi:CHAD domain-containing protein
VGAQADPAKVKKLRRKMRGLTRYLGPIRELDVQLGMIEGQGPSDDMSRSALALVRRDVANRRQRLRKALKAEEPISDLKKLLKRLEKIAKSGSDHDDTRRAALAATLIRRARGLKTALDEAGPLYATGRVHAVRIATKKLRYALEIVQDAGQADAKALLRVLKREQDRLGHLHDLEAMLKHIREAAASPRVGRRLPELAAYADSIERDVRRLHAEFVEARDVLFESVTEVRQTLVPSLTVLHKRQANAGSSRRSQARAVKRA